MRVKSIMDRVRNFTGNCAHLKLHNFKLRTLTYLPDDKIKDFTVVHLRRQWIFVSSNRLVIRNGRQENI